MRTTALLALLGLAPAALALAVPTASLAIEARASVQDAKPDNRPEIKSRIDELNAHIDKKGKEDSEAVGVLDKLHQEFPLSGPKDRAAIVKAINECFEAKRQESEDGVRDNKLYLAAAVSLRDMGPESAPILRNWIGHKAHRKDIALQQKLILSLGRTHDETGRKELLDLLTDKTPAIQAAAAEALGEFAESDQKIRKENFEKLLNTGLMPIKALIDVPNPTALDRERYDTVAAPIITSLQRLSKHEEQDPNKWLRWWNDNKTKDWTKS
jgi:hypothetical protein